MFCKKCGKEIKDDAIFCPWCGEKAINTVINYKKTTINPNSKKPKLPKKLIAIIVIIAIIVCGGSVGFNTIMKINGHSNYQFSYKGIELVSKKICHNIKNGKANIEEIEESYTGTYYVNFNVTLLGKQKETIEVMFDNYKDTDSIGTICIEMHPSSAYSHGENTYNCCIALASSIEKTFFAKRYVDEYRDYYGTLDNMNKLNWTDDYIILQSYSINNGPEITIAVDDCRWKYILELM